MKISLALIVLLFNPILLASTPSKYDTDYFTDANELNVLTKKQKIAVLVGLGMDHIIKQAPDYLDPLLAHQLNIIKTKFNDGYSNQNFEVEVSFYPDRFTLWNTLTSPDYVAVFWIGHGSNGKEAKLYDGDGFDITELFSTYHPNLRYLALIGCYSKKAFGPLKRKIVKNNPKLKIINFEDKIQMHESIDLAISRSFPILNRTEVKNGYKCISKRSTGLYINFKRTCSGINRENIGHYPAVTVSSSHNGKIITAFPPCMKINEVQTATAHIVLSKDDFNARGELIASDKLNIRITSGDRIFSNLDDFVSLNLGQFSITTNKEEMWFGIIDPESGTNTQVDEENFFFAGEINNKSITSFNEYLCEDMPSRD